MRRAALGADERPQAATPPSTSSSATNAKSNVPRQVSRPADKRRPASTIDVIEPLASQAPLAKSLPSRSMRRRGSLVHPPPTGTVSMWELKAKHGPAPLSSRATTFARPSTRGLTSVAKAHAFELHSKKRRSFRFLARRILSVDRDEPLEQANK